MVEIKSKLKVKRSAYRIEVKDRLELPFETRQKSRFKAKLASGEEVGVILPRGEILRGGDLVTASDGRVFEVIAQPESVLDIRCKAARDLARVAYHLGNRHVAVEVGEGCLRIAHDHVLEGMIAGLGATIEHLTAPFEPEAGAYSGVGHEHGAAKIHDHHEHCDHDHDQDHDHGHHHHPHDHDHKH